MRWEVPTFNPLFQNKKQSMVFVDSSLFCVFGDFGKIVVKVLTDRLSSLNIMRPECDHCSILFIKYIKFIFRRARLYISINILNYYTSLCPLVISALGFSTATLLLLFLMVIIIPDGFPWHK